MSILLLSLLLLLLVGIGALMGRRVTAIERFQDAAPKHSALTEPQTFQITGTVNVDPLARDMAVQAAVVDGGKRKPASAPEQHMFKPASNPMAKPAQNPNPFPHMPTPGPTSSCPDMSQYIRMDEIPCWNCTLP